MPPHATSLRCSSNSFANSPDPDAMFTFNGSLKVYVALEACDLRKSFNTLAKSIIMGIVMLDIDV